MHIDTLKFYKYTPVKKPMYKGKFCRLPFDTLQIDQDGDVQLCDCQLHMPYTIGNIYKNSLQDIWLGEAADRVRQAVADEDFTYCNWNCAKLVTLPKRPAVLPVVQDFPRIIKLDMDRSCNLKCPSCREDVIMEKHSDTINKQIELYESIKQWALANPNKPIRLIPVGSGDVFASHSGLAFLKSLQDYPHNNLKLVITTNGTLINRNQALLDNINHLIGSFTISIDASTPETYAQVRGGDWDELLLGLDFVKNNLKRPVTFNFCIQKKNYHEVESFAAFANQFNAGINYQKILDWGHWDIAWWHDNNALDRTKDAFVQVIDSIRQVQSQYPRRVTLAAEITKYLEQAKQSS
jgi:radical SAM protein with 4Fe4S-binding SPASM domain